MKPPKYYRVVTLFDGFEIGIVVSANSKAAARRCVGGNIVRVEVLTDEQRRPANSV